MQLLDKRVVESIKKLREGGTSWLREQASHWTTADSLALVLEDKMKDKNFCAEEGWVEVETEDTGWAWNESKELYPEVYIDTTGTSYPDIWAETVDYPEERPITLMVIEDLLARDRMGHEKHGRPLTKSTYTDFHKELYEELMDALVYLRALRENNEG